MRWWSISETEQFCCTGLSTRKGLPAARSPRQKLRHPPVRPQSQCSYQICVSCTSFGSYRNCGWYAAAMFQLQIQAQGQPFQPCRTSPAFLPNCAFLYRALTPLLLLCLLLFYLTANMSALCARPGVAGLVRGQGRPSPVSAVLRPRLQRSPFAAQAVSRHVPEAMIARRVPHPLYGANTCATSSLPRAIGSEQGESAQEDRKAGEGHSGAGVQRAAGAAGAVGSVHLREQLHPGWLPGPARCVPHHSGHPHPVSGQRPWSKMGCSWEM